MASSQCVIRRQGPDEALPSKAMRRGRGEGRGRRGPELASDHAVEARWRPPEEQVERIAREIASKERASAARPLHLSWWADRLLGQAMADPAFRTRLFRFVDTYPTLRGDSEVVEHLMAELDGLELPRWMSAGLAASERMPNGERLVAKMARRSIERMARQFIAGTDPLQAAAVAGEKWARSLATTVDLLGEHTHSEAEADRYASRLSGMVEALAKAASCWPADERLERDDLGPVPRASVSVKVTALAPSFTPLAGRAGIEQAERRLLPILELAASSGVSVWFDMESYDVKSLTHELFRRIALRQELAELHLGVVVQAYLADAALDLEEVASLAKARALPLAVRLVKGAYHDTEGIEAAQRGWPAPVFAMKEHTDLNFERLAVRLAELHGKVRPAFASHNLRSIAVAISAFEQAGYDERSFELQLLYGMAEPLEEALAGMGFRVRVYAPVGELVPGMAYLVRRLLENTSNESFVRHHFAEHQSLEVLLRAPAMTELPGPPPLVRKAPSDVARLGPYSPEPPAEWRRAPVMGSFASAMSAELSRPARFVPAIIGGEPVRTGRSIFSVDPAEPGRVVAEAAACGVRDVDDALDVALQAQPAWGRKKPEERAQVMLEAAENLRQRRFEIAALEVHEVGKGWADADADVCEAIDYLEYYARRMLHLARGGEVQSPPGEENRLSYLPKGVCAVVAPWNFPLAILTGMTAAALVTGNAAVVKPAEQSPAVAAELVAALQAGGIPPGVLALLPGTGEEAGAPLVADPRVDVVAFTGSREVGLQILRAAYGRGGGHSIPRVVAELGGKNAVIVDYDADLDEVVPAVVSSAFGFAGQRCSAASRLICLDRIHDAMVSRVVEAARSLVVAPPRLSWSQVGPVIDQASKDRLDAALCRAGEAGEVRLAREDVPAEGYFVGPAVVDRVDPDSWLATEELFGPVLATFSVPDLDAAVALAESTDYALTAGVFSRSARRIDRVVSGLRAGNVYVNRAITGAVVGRQPFGGNRMSGIGSKAGGPDYLLQFCDSQVVSENTVRQGFAPATSGRSGGKSGGKSRGKKVGDSR